MSHRNSTVAAAFAAVLLNPLVASAQDVNLRGSWWHGPAAPTRHTTLVAAFDGTGTDADAAAGDRRSGGFGMAAGVPGKHGQAVRIADRGGHLHFRGTSNINLHRGTLRLQVRGQAWQDETPRWLFEARGNYRLGVRRDRHTLSLVLSEGKRTQSFSQVDLRVGEISADAWHSVVASWDRETGRGWIALDGRGAQGRLDFPASHEPAFVIYAGGGFGGRLGGLNESGMEIDDLVLYNQPLSVLEADRRALPADDAALLARAEQGARKTLHFIAGLQRWGGWQTIYTWPTLIGCSYQGREAAESDSVISNDKGHATPYIAARFLYAYEVLGDERFLEVALRTAETLVAAQSPRGFWLPYYRMTAGGIVPHGSGEEAKLQDSVQSHPVYFLAYLHRLTGDARYLDAAKRAGEFHLAAQNPNGSWSHHWDDKAGIGRTATGLPQGGEINDNCINDAIEVMVLMHHLTGDRRYVEAVRRAGDWLLRAQLTGATVGWAAQYDRDDRPAWARAFEPPAWCGAATVTACEALIELHRLSGDERYLRPVRDCLAWLEQRFPDGSGWYFLDEATGRPIAAWEKKVHFLDEPGKLEWLRTQPIGVWYVSRTRTVASVRRLLEAAPRPAGRPPAVTSETALARLSPLRQRVEEALSAQNEAGVWVVPRVANFMGSLGAGFGTHSLPALWLLNFVEAARTAAGELPASWRGDGEILRMAYPKADWYGIAWAGAVGR